MLSLLPVLAELAAADLPSTSALLTYGPLGVITAWLMYRDEKRAMQMRETEAKMAEQQAAMMHRIDGLTRALLVDSMAREHMGDSMKTYARDMLAKIDALAGSSK